MLIEERASGLVISVNQKPVGQVLQSPQTTMKLGTMTIFWAIWKAKAAAGPAAFTIATPTFKSIEGNPMRKHQMS